MSAGRLTVGDVLRDIVRDPLQFLVLRWNWKSALSSPVLRAILFLCANLTAGWRAALGAAAVELLYRAPTAGVYGSLTQAFRQVDPPWAAGLTVMVLLPTLSHSLEFGVHYLRGTPKLTISIIASVCFTALSTLFNLYAMRRGVLLVGRDAGSVGSDLRRLPVTIAMFVAAGPIAVYRVVRVRVLPRPLTRVSACEDAD